MTDRAYAFAWPLALLGALSACSGSDPAPTPVPPAAVPPPLASKCDASSRPETGIQGRVSKEDHDSGRAAQGYTCNTVQVGAFTAVTETGSVGGFKVERYVDKLGHECAFYDTTLLYPANAFGGEAGVNVLDMSNPAKPTLAARLLTPAMQSPHESVVVSQERGLLLAVQGNPAFGPGVVDIYDIDDVSDLNGKKGCLAPVLKSSLPVGTLGHESGIAPDGDTFYTAALDGRTLTAIDVSNTQAPVQLWSTDKYAPHGMSVSDDGNFLYLAARSGLVILDVSKIQNRPDTQQPPRFERTVPRCGPDQGAALVCEVGLLVDTVVDGKRKKAWGRKSTPQIAIPVTIGGHPYVVEIDEFVDNDAEPDEVGAGRIIDIGDKTSPREIATMRLAVHELDNFDAQAQDPGNTDPDGTTQFQGYAGHYCNVPKREDPGIVACSMILSGLRIFDIRDPHNPKEVAYFNAPVKNNPATLEANYAMSSPAFDPESRDIWYSDANSGFYVVRVSPAAWPNP